MRKRMIVLLLLLLLPALSAAEDGPYLTGETLRALRPAYEQFLTELSEHLIENGLLPEADREAWMNYQLGDYFQSGGFGAITALYTPGLLQIADESVALQTFSLETEAGTLRFCTLNRYSTAYSPLPGLPLDDIQLTDDDGEPIECRFGWTAPHGSLWIWNGATDELVNVGAAYLNDGKPLFWYAEPIDGIRESLTLTLLSPEDNSTLATAELLMTSGSNFWAPESLLGK